MNGSASRRRRARGESSGDRPGRNAGVLQIHLSQQLFEVARGALERLRAELHQKAVDPLRLNEAADAVGGFEDCYFQATTVQLVGGRQTGNAGSDDSHRSHKCRLAFLPGRAFLQENPER